jgi:hypothetical protein
VSYQKARKKKVQGFNMCGEEKYSRSNRSRSKYVMCVQYARKQVKGGYKW